MNITKRMLRFGVAALAIAIGSQALAAPIISESFEGPANGTLVTNLTNWSSTGGDLSAITNMGDYGYTATSLPLTNSVTHTNVVQLVEGAAGTMLSFMPVTQEPLFEGEGASPVYVDTMVRFVLSDGDPAESSITNDTKIAIFANSSSNLVIRHAVVVGGGVTNSVTATVIDPEVWYRLTVKMTIDELGYVCANVMVNSNIVTHAVNAPGGLFYSALLTDSDMYLRAVSFQGAGYIDDVVVTRDVPTFGGTGSGFFYVIKEYTNDVFVIHHTVTSPSAWTNIYAAATSTWYTNKLGTNTTVGMFTLHADNTTVTAPVPNGTEPSTTNILNVLLDQAKTAGQLPTQFTGMSPTEIARIRGYGNLPDVQFYTGDNTLAFEQAMKLNPYVNEAVTNVITSLTVGTPNSTIIVKVTTNGVAYASASDLTLNILIDSKMSLTNVWPDAAGITNELKYLNVLGETNITFATSSGQFFRTRIVPK